MPFVVISVSYLLFTVTDGAMRMIVLLHAYQKGFTALQVALMFTLYELAGVVTNLGAGLAGAKWGIKCTLVTGLSLQLVAYALLFGWQEEWDDLSAIVYVTVAQMFGGIAKDLTKLGGKTVTKLVTPEEQSSRLFKLVSLLTGWKNSLKGVGYFAGSALVAVNYELALGCMMALVVSALPFALFGLDRQLGTARKKNVQWADIFMTKNANLNWLSLARLFLFASRDFWFEVPLPFFLRSPRCEGLGSDRCLSDGDCPSGAGCQVDVCVSLNVGGGCGGFGWSRVLVGAILAAYIILYGQVQSWSPQLILGPLKQSPPNQLTEMLWGALNCLPTAAMAVVFGVYSTADGDRTLPLAASLMSAVVTFAVIFAVNSSIHSFLVVHYAKEDKVATSVGFYYMSNACGRLLGTLGSGVLYTYVGEDQGAAAGNDNVVGLAACFVAGTMSSLVAALVTYKIHDEAATLHCGSCVCRRGQPATLTAEAAVAETVKDVADHPEALPSLADGAV
uniref:Uncharacterized protein n=1 Tax=Calcidiscus leptoporus TaxID=127549 RepID=A0A7S0JEI9_9EUKA